MPERMPRLLMDRGIADSARWVGDSISAESVHELCDGELSVALNTVGTHLRSIYAKLQVRDRYSAVQRRGAAAAGRWPRG